MKDLISKLSSQIYLEFNQFVLYREHTYNKKNTILLAKYFNSWSADWR